MQATLLQLFTNNSLGNTTLGMSREEVRCAVGEPFSSSQEDDIMIYGGLAGQFQFNFTDRLVEDIVWFTFRQGLPRTIELTDVDINSIQSLKNFKDWLHKEGISYRQTNNMAGHILLVSPSGGTAHFACCQEENECRLMGVRASITTKEDGIWDEGISLRKGYGANKI